MSAHDRIELAAARPDFAAIAAWIPHGATVLDLGCGDGSLLRYLKETRKVRGYGPPKVSSLWPARSPSP